MTAIEVKHSRLFRREHTKGITAFTSAKKVRGFVVYRGDREMLVDGVVVLPLETFLRRLTAGEIIG